MTSKTNKNSGDELKDFAASLVAEKDFTGVDEKVMEQIRKDVYDRLEKRINVFIMSELSPEKLEEFDKIVAKGNEDAIQEFCASNIKDLDQKIAEQLILFRQNYLGI